MYLGILRAETTGSYREAERVLKTSAVAGTVLVFSGAKPWAKDADARIEVFSTSRWGRYRRISTVSSQNTSAA